MSQLKKGAILSYVNIGLTNVIGLMLTPFIIRSLGNSEYGLYLLIGSIIGYISILDLGLNNAIVRYVSKYQAEKDIEGEENFLATTMLIYAGISMVIIAIGLVIYFNIDFIFKDSLKADEIVKARKMFLILIFNLAITLPGGAFTAICNAYEHFVFPRLLLILKYISRGALIFTLLLYFPYALTLVWIDTILNVVIIGISIYYVIKVLKVRFKMHAWRTKLIKDIFSYSIWVFILALILRLQWNAGQVILGISSDTISVAIFGVGIMLGGYYGAFAGAINTLLLPKATRMSVNENDEKSYNFAMQKIGRLNGFILFLVLTGFYVYGREFIILWVGESYLSAYEIAFLIMIAMTLPLMQSFGNSILEAKKKNRFKSIISIITVTFAVFMGIYLVPEYHFQGVIYPLFIAMLLNSAIMTWYYNKIFGFNFINFIKKTILQPLIFGALPVTIIFLFVKNYWKISSWIDLSWQVTLFTVVYLVVNYFVVMNVEEKEILNRIKR
ncbi:oligosaccharide flippase family protein [Aequorivita sp. KMM 9714]|uniref:oligosaccharide flippase family protein n=1 Tax=Aequorivita sp. KMM 9714 TaxID=2707173 RepID=UPI0013EB2BB1|nr:oligosaccharide flippase family protein [Aequorivita sp. KMM 9714]NGX84739.1 oligosaccharide flippase family protein [Aequorivita sp. KMM 9714]